MRKYFLLSMLLFLLTGTLVQAQQPDSIYFYKDGAIVYGEATTQIDSLTFHATNYYDLQRSEAIYSKLASYPELSIFTSMILRSGYSNNLINKTIWAPTNASFQDMDPKDMLDLNSVRRILNNQMCRNYVTTYNTFGIGKIRMYSGKTFTFSKSDAGYDLAGNRLLKTDIAMGSSIIHTVDGKNPYPLNIWEYIEQADGLDSLRTYIKSLTTMKQFSNIYVNGTFMDTITLPQNDMFDFLANINLEDSIYTVLLPDNDAFIEALNRLLPYCKSPTGVPFQTDAAKWMILRELVFRNILTIPSAKDFIYSVSGTKYEHPDSLFLGATSTTELSNGVVYKVKHLKAFELGFQKRPIRIEAEDKTNNKVSANNYELGIYWYRDFAFDISNGKYLLCKSTTTSSLSLLNVFFPLLNAFAMKYNLYVGFVPSVVSDTIDLRPYKLDFYLTTNGDDASGSPTYTKMNASNFITNPTTLTKVLVAENFDFPSCTIGHGLNVPLRIQLKIRNMGGATTTEIKNYNRSMRIDYILLEPVE